MDFIAFGKSTVVNVFLLFPGKRPASLSIFHKIGQHQIIKPATLTLHRRVVQAIALAAHRRRQAMSYQDFLAALARTLGGGCDGSTLLAAGDAEWS